MDVLSPARTCDPWAVRSATLARESGDTTESSGLQQQILRLLEKTDGMAVSELASRLSAHQGDIEREIAALRHMEIVRGALLEGKKIIRLW
jgi:predicted transcriptional regulator